MLPSRITLKEKPTLEEITDQSFQEYRGQRMYPDKSLSPRVLAEGVYGTHPELFTTVAHELLVQASGSSLLSNKGNAESDEGEELDHS